LRNRTKKAAILAVGMSPTPNPRFATTS